MSLKSTPRTSESCASAGRRSLRSASEQPTSDRNRNPQPNSSSASSSLLSGSSKRKQSQPLSRSEKEKILWEQQHKERPRVQAQRKFAQGSSVPSSATSSPVKSSIRSSSSHNAMAANASSAGANAPSSSSSSSTASGPTSRSPTKSLVTSKSGERPKTEDFLTFLCLRGTNLLPPELDFFNQASITNEEESSDLESSDNDHNGKLTGAVARKTVQRRVSKDESAESSRNNNKNVTSAVQALKKKYTDQRLAKKVVSKTLPTVNNQARRTRSTRQETSKSTTVRRTSRPTRNSSEITKTRSGKQSENATQQLKSRKPQSAAALVAKSKTRMATLGAASSRVSRMLTRLTPRGITSTAFVKSTRKIALASRTLRGREISLSSEEEDEEEVEDEENEGESGEENFDEESKKTSKTKTPLRKLKSRKTLEKQEQSESDADEENSSRESSRKRKRVPTKHDKVMLLRQRATRSISRDSSASKDSARSESSKRPSRKTKEAATVYLNMLGQKLSSAKEDNDDDNISIESLNEVTQEKRLKESVTSKKEKKSLDAAAQKVIIVPAIVKKSASATPEEDTTDSEKKKSSKSSKESQDKKKSKQSLKQLQDMLLEEAKMKIATSPMPASGEKIESDNNGERDERFTISHKTGYIQVKPRKSTDQPLSESETGGAGPRNPAVLLGPNGRRLSQNGERTVTPPRKILPKIESTTPACSHLPVGVMGASRISSSASLTPAGSSPLQQQPSSVPLSQPLVITTNFSGANAYTTSSGPAVSAVTPQVQIKSHQQHGQPIRMPLQMGLIPVQMQQGQVVTSSQPHTIISSTPNSQMTQQTQQFTPDQFQRMPIQVTGMQQIALPGGIIHQPNTQTVIRSPYGFTFAQPINSIANPQQHSVPMSTINSIANQQQHSVPMSTNPTRPFNPHQMQTPGCIIPQQSVQQQQPPSIQQPQQQIPKQESFDPPTLTINPKSTSNNKPKVSQKQQAAPPRISQCDNSTLVSPEPPTLSPQQKLPNRSVPYQQSTMTSNPQPRYQNPNLSALQANPSTNQQKQQQQQGNLPKLSKSKQKPPNLMMMQSTPHRNPAHNIPVQQQLEKQRQPNQVQQQQQLQQQIQQQQLQKQKQPNQEQQQFQQHQKIQQQQNPQLQKQTQLQDQQHTSKEKRIFSKSEEKKIGGSKLPQSSFKVDNEVSPYAFEAESAQQSNTAPYRTPKAGTSSVSSGACNQTKLSSSGFKIEDSKELGSSIPIPAELANQLAAQAKKEKNPGNSEMTYFIPLQNSSGQSFGVAVKLGTEGPEGPNQKVIMKAKLVTQPTGKPIGARIIGSRESETESGISEGGATATASSKGTKRKYSKMQTMPSDDSDDTDDSRSTLNSPDSARRKKMRMNQNPISRSSQDSSEENDCCLGPIEMMERFPKLGQHAHLVEAPVYKPSEKEFQNPMKYIGRIRKEAEQFGFCKIIPPKSFKPECNVDDDMRFTAYNQVIQKMMHRWGPNTKEMAAITKYLETQNITIKTHPMVGGVELDLPALYHAVQSFGGLTEVIQRKRWGKIADYLRLPKGTQDRGNKLDEIYCKYLLPYDTLSPVERDELLRLVEEEFEERNKKKLDQSKNDEDEEEEEISEDEEDMDCVLKGKSTSLAAFYRVAKNMIGSIFRNEDPDTKEIEEEYWRHVVERDSHIQVQQGSIDTGDEGFGFPTSKNSSCGRHPWNLKILSNNPRSLLRCMGPVMGVTVPTLNVSMVFTSGCWYRDPHGLPIVDYHHSGSSKVWYGVPNSQSIAFYTAMKQLVPTFCRKKKIWLSADTAMVPPNQLVKYGVSVCRTVQEPGQFLVIFPKTYNSYVSTGYSISESVFFAPKDYLDIAENEFGAIRDSSEPMMFPLPKLLLCIAQAEMTTKEILLKVKPLLEKLRDNEYVKRTIIADLGVKTSERIVLKTKKDDQDDEYECEVCSENLYISYLYDQKEDTYFCKEHAIEYLQERKSSQRKSCKLYYTHSKDEMSAIIKMLNKRLSDSEEDTASSSSSDDEVTIRRVKETPPQPKKKRPQSTPTPTTTIQSQFSPASSISSIPSTSSAKETSTRSKPTVEKSSSKSANKKQPVESSKRKSEKTTTTTKKAAQKPNKKKVKKSDDEEEDESWNEEETNKKSTKRKETAAIASTSKQINVKRRKTKARKAATDKSGNLAVELLDMLLSASEESEVESEEEDESSDESWK